MANKSNQSIFHVLHHLESGNFEFFATVHEEFFKDVSPYVVLMWLRGAHENNEAVVVLVDEIANKNFFSFYKHPRLQMLLLCSAMVNTGAKHFSFIKQEKDPLEKPLKAIAREFMVSRAVARMYYDRLSESEIERIMALQAESDVNKRKG